MESVRQGETAKRRGDALKFRQRTKTGLGSGRPKHQKSKGADPSNSPTFMGTQRDARTKDKMNCCTEAQVCVNSKEPTELLWTLECELMKVITLGIGSTNGRSSEDECILEGFVGVIKQRGQGLAINDHSAYVMILIGKRFQTNKIISIAAGEKK